MLPTLFSKLHNPPHFGAIIFSSREILFRNFSGVISASVRTTIKPRKTKLVGRQAPLTLTSAAVDRIKELMVKNPRAVGLRVGVRTRGCNGLSYTLDYCVDGRQPGEEIVEQDGVRIFIDRRAQLTLLGTEMDYQVGLLASEFVFNNPNVKGTCGCGESFNI
ncbi:Iron-sulfur cluster assembly 1 like protein mitochondrial [Fasciolopsis buskii]|uniref:Iron-sulfur cluster assembly 1 homolog, mitochondrial n=1 Tax=Fasciolopsis buskii TaxID=27845 RepID=A0A8E0RSH5_9TREM|nr:Iron-sulfur cluster assembly 1 like protein mitochondrial [Fasciolopsis buski]